MPNNEEYAKYREYYRNYALQCYHKHKNDPAFRKRVTESHAKWQRNNPEKANASARKHANKVRENWGYSNKRIAKMAEILAAQEILPSLGFEDILLLSEFRCSHMIYDILARKNGERYGIQVKTTVVAQLEKGQRVVARFFGITYLILFIKPTLDYYRLIRSPIDFKGVGVYNKSNLIIEGKLKTESPLTI